MGITLSLKTAIGRSRLSHYLGRLNPERRIQYEKEKPVVQQQRKGNQWLRYDDDILYACRQMIDLSAQC